MSKSKRPYHGPKQVRTLKGVKPGHFYYECNGKDKENLIVALSHPLSIDCEQWFHFVKWPLLSDAGLNPKDLMECSQLSITPIKEETEKKGEFFHQTKWLERCSTRSPLNEYQIDDLWEYLPVLDDV